MYYFAKNNSTYNEVPLYSINNAEMRYEVDSGRIIDKPCDCCHYEPHIHILDDIQEMLVTEIHTKLHYITHKITARSDHTIMIKFTNGQYYVIEINNDTITLSCVNYDDGKPEETTQIVSLMSYTNQLIDFLDIALSNNQSVLKVT